MSLNIYKVKYDGSWLGGKALVIARSPRTAIKLVERDKATVNFEDIEVENLGQVHLQRVVYNDNGEY